MVRTYWDLLGSGRSLSAQEFGLCLHAVGNTIICAPPLVLSHAEADELMDLTLKSLDTTYTALQD